MIKEVHSWSKPYLENLIGRKKVDWSMFKYGTTIPKVFHEEFFAANKDESLVPGEDRALKLWINGESYEANLVYLDRSGSNGILQIRYDQNNSLKDKLIKCFSKTYNYLQNKRQENPNKMIIVPNEHAEYVDFYQTDQPYEYEVKLRTKVQTNAIPTFWWVNQGKSYQIAREGGYLWAPQQSKRGHAVPHHVRLLEANIGDIVFCYSSLELKSIGIVKEKAIESNNPFESDSDWQRDGYLLEVDHYDLNPIVKRDEIPIEWRLTEDGPFDVHGNIKQGYFFNVSFEFANKIIANFNERFPEEIRGQLSKYVPNTGENQVLDSELEYFTDGQIIEHINEFIKSKGFLYSKDDIINLFLSLKTKPFVILSGISGTGKTKIAQLFADSIGATEENGQFLLIPVRPDWNDSSDLLGYIDIQGDFKEGPLTTIIKKAIDHPDKPYFVLLDEMNLARVEYYFSDILSVMESKKWEDGEIISSLLLTKDTAGFDLRLPENLYIIGTVNMDETTHPFSKKVLDRSNTIEFNQIDLANLAFLEDSEKTESVSIGHNSLASSFLHLKDAYISHEDLIHQVIEELVQINQVLEPMYAHVGYRVRDEICFYLIYNEDANLLPFHNAFDYCILQKILPRISGSDLRVDRLLRDLYQLFTSKVYDETNDDISIDIETAKYPRSAKKVLEMLRRLEEDGFTSFWIS